MKLQLASHETYLPAVGAKLRGAARREKIWTGTVLVWIYCNPLKSHKTAKRIFGKAWRKKARFGNSLEESLERAERVRAAPAER